MYDATPVNIQNGMLGRWPTIDYDLDKAAYISYDVGKRDMVDMRSKIDEICQDLFTIVAKAIDCTFQSKVLC